MALSSLTVEARGLDGVPYRVNVNGGGTNLTNSNQTPQQFLRIQGGEPEDRGLNPIWPKRLRLFMLDVDLDPLFGKPDRSVPVEAYDISGSSDTLVYEGFMITDFFGDAPFAAENIVELQALDGLGTLENDGLDQIYSEEDTFVSYVDAITRILGTLYLMRVEFGTDWYPSEGNLSSSDNPLAETGFNPNNYREDRPDGGWDNQLSVLKDLCRSEGLVIRQVERSDGAKWHVRQRDALNSDGTIKVWEYDNGATLVDGPKALDRSQTISVPDGDIRQKHSRDFVRRRQAVEVTHDHTEIDQLVTNSGFESGIEEWVLVQDSETSVSVEDHSGSPVTPDPTSENQKFLAITNDTTTYNDRRLVAYQPLGELTGIVGSYRIDLSFEVFYTKDQLQELRLKSTTEGNDYYTTTTRTDVRTDRVLKGENEIPVQPITSPIPSGSVLPIIKPDDKENDKTVGLITTSERVDAGGEVIRGEVSTTVEGSDLQVAFIEWLKDSTVAIETPTFVQSSSSGRTWKTLELFAPAVAKDGTVLDGELEFQFTPELYYYTTNRYDNIQVKISAETGAIGETVTRATVQEFGKTEAQKARLFSGPTAQNLARVKGDGFKPVSWGLGSGGGDLSLAELNARQRLRYWRNHNAKWTVTTADRDGSLRLTGDELVTFDGDLYTVHSIEYDPAAGETRATLIRWKDQGTSGIELQTVLEQSGEQAASGSTGGSSATGGGSSVTGWDEIPSKPFTTVDDGSSGTLSTSSDELSVTSENVASALSHSPGLADGIQQAVREDGSATDAALVTEQAVRKEVDLTTVSVDLGDDDSTEITPLSQISVTGDADNIFSGGDETNELEIAVGQQWPNADKLDGYEGSDLAALAEDETVTGQYTFSEEIQADLGLTSSDDLMPDQGYAHSIGSSTDKWLTLDVAELRVSTLVAEKELATVGGRQLVGTANELAEAVAAADASIVVKYNNLESGDFIRLEGGGKVEFMKVTSSASGTGPYTYDVDRDLDGTGKNAWDQGDGLFSTSQGEGFIDLYAEHSFTDAGQSTIAGPTIEFREQGAGGYADVSERAAVGNLHDTYGYTSDTYGIAAGDPDNDYFTADPSGIEFVDGQTNTVTAQLNSQIFSVGPNQNLKYDAAAGRLSVGDWTVNQTDIRSLPASGDAGLILSTDLEMGRFQEFGASLRATSDMTDSTAGPFVELFVEDAGSFGLYAEDGSGNAVFGLGSSPAGVNRSEDFFINGSLVIDDTITADEIDVEDFWATDATVKNSLTMGSSGEIVDDVTPPNYRFSSKGIELRATDTTRAEAREITWRKPDLSSAIQGEMYVHNDEMVFSMYSSGGNDARTIMTAYNYGYGVTPGAGDNKARIELFGDQDGGNEINMILTGNGSKLNIRNTDVGGVVFDFDPFDWSMGFKKVYNFDSVPGGSPPSPTDGLKLYAKDELTGNDVPYLWFITENGTQYRVDATPIT